MATLSLRLPESIHRKLSEPTKTEGVSLNQLLSSAAAEKLSALTAETYLADRAARSSRVKLDSVLAGDELPAGYTKRRRRR